MLLNYLLQARQSIQKALLIFLAPREVSPDSISQLLNRKVRSPLPTQPNFLVFGIIPVYYSRANSS